MSTPTLSDLGLPCADMSLYAPIQGTYQHVVVAKPPCIPEAPPTESVESWKKHFEVLLNVASVPSQQGAVLRTAGASESISGAEVAMVIICSCGGNLQGEMKSEGRVPLDWWAVVPIFKRGE